MKIEVWYAVDEFGTHHLFTNMPTRTIPKNKYAYWSSITAYDYTSIKDGGFNCMCLSEEDVKNLNLPKITWKDEPIKLELDIQAMVINK